MAPSSALGAVKKAFTGWWTAPTDGSDVGDVDMPQSVHTQEAMSQVVEHFGEK